MTIHKKRQGAIVLAVPSQARWFLIKHLELLSKDYEISLILNHKSYEDNLDFIPKNIRIVNIPISRKIKLANDFHVLFLLYKLFKKNNFFFVYSVSPKAGLLAMTSAFFSNIPIRVHYFTGQVWSTKKGFFRILLKTMDRLTTIFSTNIFIDSKSQKEFLMQNNIVNNSSIVLGDGSICGVNLSRFAPNKDNRFNVREEIGIDKKHILFLYMGRLNKEKGIYELTTAFEELLITNKSVYLLVIGSDEEDFQNYFECKFKKQNDNFKYLNNTLFPEKYFQAADVLCVPSYREGFGNVVIEAAGCGVPAIGTNIYGLKDTIEHNKTGILVESQNINDLLLAMMRMASNQNERIQMGINARQRVKEKFSEDIVMKNFSDLFNEILNE